MSGDFFADARDLIARSPLRDKGWFVVDVRYAANDEGALFKLTFFPDNARPRIVAKWIIDLMQMAEEGATHRELIQKGLDAIQEAYTARGYDEGTCTPA